ncbi:(2Fe-2S) ferredoxin domain-containing protein [Microcoleus sp. FACHB-1515]|uniref:(2Fe-2S) ferredoxin domain-containing protein n=1 Tax=Cyanophyceae TaxID=3028117 RepID=UPI001688BD9A|nr:(2Fe-2S) ferredoxin domain-containing protein [Microcoleus sp. FACHB-1515]MBD2090006.1 (2Fe-2S) ferredoxin domain-containing protein [Microcoleus sp. FACHB-1515]
MYQHDERSPFAFEGRFLGFAADGAKLKYVRVETPIGAHLIKMPKDQRQSLYRQLIPGDWLQVSGYQKRSGSKTKWKAEVIYRTASSTATLPTSADLPVPEKPADSGKPACILFCQKSDCCKKGAKQVASAIEAEIRDRGLNATVKGTGCMKRCKAGPNLVMPDKTRYTQIRSQEVAAIMDKHFPESIESIEPKAEKRVVDERVAVGV